MEKRTALILGNGSYALSLHSRLRLHSDVVAFTVSLFPQGTESAANDDRVGMYGGLYRPSGVIAALRRNHITHVILGGDVRLAALSTFDKLTLRTRSMIDPVLRNMLLSIRRGSIGGALSIFSDAIRAAGVEPILASELLPDLKPDPGAMTLVGHFATRHNELSAHTQRLAELAYAELDNQPFAHVRQALLFDGEAITVRETRGTDALLEEAARHERTTAPRALVKLCPRQFDHRMDPPVVAVKTFELARDAKVDLVIVDCNLGIIHDREDVEKICRQANISLFGFDSAELQAAPLQVNQ